MKKICADVLVIILQLWLKLISGIKNIVNPLEGQSSLMKVLHAVDLEVTASELLLRGKNPA